VIWIWVYTIFISYNLRENDFHDFHVSRTEINYNSTEGSLEISVHLFADDLENALSKKGYTAKNIGTQKESVDADTFIEKYLHEKLTVSHNNKPLKWNYVGKETTKDLMAVYCYLEVEGCRNISKLMITATQFLEIFDDQKNIVVVTKDKKQVGFFILDNTNTSDLAILN
jgi:hypothetical protein